jgi:fructose-specific phosphotransferase system IIC component
VAGAFAAHSKTTTAQASRGHSKAAHAGRSIGNGALTLVLVMMIGVGVAERSGLIGAAIGGLVRATPAALLTAAVVFTGVMSSLAADAGYVVLVPLAAPCSAHPDAIHSPVWRRPSLV